MCVCVTPYNLYPIPYTPYSLYNVYNLYYNTGGSHGPPGAHRRLPGHTRGSPHRHSGAFLMCTIFTIYFLLMCAIYYLLCAVWCVLCALWCVLYDVCCGYMLCSVLLFSASPLPFINVPTPTILSKCTPIYIYPCLMYPYLYTPYLYTPLSIYTPI